MFKDLLRRFGRFIWNGLVQYGMSVAGVPGQAPVVKPESTGRPLTGPGPRHPERLAPDQPLSPLEQQLWRQLS